MQFQPSFRSLRTHIVPQWFHDAKFGIFIHWGLYSLPAFAVCNRPSKLEIVAKEGWIGLYRLSQYAEWYLNSIRIPTSPAHSYHKKTYGESFHYEDFIPQWERVLPNWNPTQWAEIFAHAGAKYVVLVTKHHDGFLLWPSSILHPKRKKYHTTRNIVGELTSTVKSHGMKMGFYYSSFFDWSFNHKSITHVSDLLTHGPITKEYTKYCYAHWKELIDDYSPSLLWGDIGYPHGGRLPELISHFYNHIPEGVINDRWMVIPLILRWFASTRIGKYFLGKWAKKNFITSKGVKPPKPKFFDYRTPEYVVYDSIQSKKFETCRGIGNSFGYNQFETEKEYLSSSAMISMLIDIVSKNGNLLLNIGPKPDGTIPEHQLTVLREMGTWLENNGDGIYATRPWIKAELKTNPNISVRCTQKLDQLFLFFLESPPSDLEIQSIQCQSHTKIHLLGSSQPIAFQSTSQGIKINTSSVPLIPSSSYVPFGIVITPIPTFLSKK